MRAVILDDVVHQACGGKIRERLYDDLPVNEGQEKQRKLRLTDLYEKGHITLDEFEEKLAKPAEHLAPKHRVLECTECGNETAVYQGKYEEGEVVYQIKLVPADTYGGRIV